MLYPNLPLAASVNDVEAAIQHIYPLVFEFRKQRSPEELQHLRQKQRQITGASDPKELEEIIVSENKAAAVDDIFVNTTAAHTTKAAAAADGVAVASIDSAQRLKQLESYRSMVQQTQEERRHIPFQSSTNTNTNTTATATALSASKPLASASAAAASASSSSSTADNICASARRRATECWATKLQNKRPRYNDPSTATAATTKSAAASNSFSNVASTSAAASAAAVHLRNPLKTAALANARMRGAAAAAGMPVNLVLNQSSGSGSSSSASRLGTVGSGTATGTGASGSSGGGFLQDQQRLQRLMQQQRGQQQLHQQKTLGLQQTSFSPSDFTVDDLIEEEESNELDRY